MGSHYSNAVTIYDCIKYVHVSGGAKQIERAHHQLLGNTLLADADERVLICSPPRDPPAAASRRAVDNRFNFEKADAIFHSPMCAQCVCVCARLWW